MSLSLKCCKSWKLLMLCLVLAMSVSSCMVHHGLSSYQEIEGIEKEATQNANKMLPAFMAHWDIHEFLMQASPELLRKVSPRTAQAYFQFLSQRLGTLKHFDGAVGQVNPMNTAAGKVWIGSYKAQASFEKGDAEVDLKLIQHQDHWEVLYFSVNSEETDER